MQFLVVFFSFLPIKTLGWGTRMQKDTAVLCLAAIAQFFNVPIDNEQFQLDFDADELPMSKTSFLRTAKQLGLRARLLSSIPERLSYLPFPAVAILKNNNFVVILRVEDKKILLYDPYYEKTITVTLEKFISTWSGEIILVTRRFYFKDIGKKFNISWFIPIFWHYRLIFGEVIIASFFLQSIALVTPLFTQVIIDKVLVHKGISTLDVLVLGMLLIAIFDVIMSIVRNYLLSHTTNKIDVVLGSKLFKHITSLPLHYFELRRVGDTVARVRELENIRQFITGSSLTVILDTFFGILFIVVMFFYSIPLSIIVLIFLPIYIIFSIAITPIYRRQLNNQFNASAESHSYLVESVTGIQTVKSLGVERRFNNRWEEILAKYVKVSFDTGMVATIANNLSRFVQSMSSLVVLWFGARQVMEGRLTVGQLIAFQMLSGQVSTPILRLVNLWQSFQQARVSVERLGDILNTPVESDLYRTKSKLPALRGDITFEKISFRYRHDGPLIIKEMDIEIGAGEKVGIVGRSGSGKSTIAKLIQRLYLPDSGRVLIDGIDLTQIDLTWLRKKVGVILQDNFLFEGSIRDNITITKPNANFEEISRAATMAGAHEFILELPEGYDTQVGERGVSLSGGQKQRIAIARTLLANPRIIIFDEATSALDYESERIIMNNMEKICSGRTVIIIAHRLSLVKDCNNIFVVDNGRVVEKGNHTTLIEKEGVYFKLYQQQEVTQC